MKHQIIKYLFFNCLVVLLAQSCGIKKFIPEGERLYTGAELELDTIGEVEGLKEVKVELTSLIEPNPNTKFLGMKPGLFFHYKAQREKPGFIYKFLNKSFGEEPVYFSEVNPERVEELIVNRLDNNGFFYSRASSETILKEKSASVNYTATLQEPYTLENYEVDMDSLPIYDELSDIVKKSPLSKDDRFDLDLLKAERERLDFNLKQRGYYNSNANLFIFEADTNQYKNRKFDLFLRLKKKAPKKTT